MSTQNNELKKVGLKVTVPRMKILAMLGEASNQGKHYSAEDLYQHLRATGEEIGLATVYRVLTQFENAGLVNRHNFEAGHSVFELASENHHDHMVDVDTGEVLELEIGVNDEGEIEKCFGRDTIEVELEDEQEEYTGLLN